MIEEQFGKEVLYRGGLKIYTTANLRDQRSAESALRRGLNELDRYKSFRGPIALIKKSEIPSFTERIHQEAVLESEVPFTFPPEGKKQEIQTPIAEETLFQGVVVSVDPKGNRVFKIGHQTGHLLAGERNRLGRSFRIGEVYWLRKKGNSFELSQQPDLEGALLSMNPLTHEVKAMVGGYSFKRSEFNRATQAMRQPGSAFKPLVYAAALDKGYTPQTTVLDAPVVYEVGPDNYWSPQNYGEKFNGLISIRGALTHSINVVAVKVMHDIGVDYTVAYAKKLGISSPIHPYLSSALGSSDTTLVNLVRAYGTLPAGGVRPNPIFIRKIINPEGKVILETPPINLNAETVFEGKGPVDPEGINKELASEGEKTIRSEKLRLTLDEQKILYGGAIPEGHVISPQTAFLMIHMMKDVIEGGTGYRVKPLGRPVAGKTGTTNEETDAWFIGTVPNRITGVWVGYDDHKSLGEKMTGGVVAAPIWLDFMKEVLADEPVRDFPPPSTLDMAKINETAGGSAAVVMKSKPTPDKTAPLVEKPKKDRGIDFLFEGL
jgi:penicillin-binding protein 1A